MDQHLFQTFQRLIHEASGIALTQEKMSLLHARIYKRLLALELDDIEEYLQVLNSDRTGEELVNLIDVVSTNVTYFYRESKHFQILGEILQRWELEQRLPIRVWCAASSSGEEPFTIAMTAAQTLKFAWPEFRLLASDISTVVLKQATERLYADHQLRDLPLVYRNAYFNRVTEDGVDYCEVNDSIARAVLFKRLNLSVFPYPLRGPLDIIFCRNVMIYFDLPLRQKIVREFERLLAPGGYLFLSHSENLLGVEHSLKPAGISVFQKVLC